MLELHTWDSPNGEKIHISIEELGLEPAIIPVDLSAGVQRSPEFLALNPTGQVPVLVDRGVRPEVVIRDSSAILIYLAERESKLLPEEPFLRYRALGWLMYQGATLAPNLGLFHQLFSGQDTAVPAVLRLLRDRTLRGYRTIEAGLAESGDFLAGEYSIADIACYSWLRAPERVGVDRDELPRVSAWLERVGARPAVRDGIAKIEALAG